MDCQHPGVAVIGQLHDLHHRDVAAGLVSAADQFVGDAVGIMLHFGFLLRRQSLFQGGSDAKYFVVALLLSVPLVGLGAGVFQGGFYGIELPVVVAVRAEAVVADP